MAHRASFLLLALSLSIAAGMAPAAAQPVLSSDPVVQARAAAARGDSAEALSRYLRVLSAKPRDLEALTGAGHAALDIGDPDAAVGFYARAEEIAPRNGQIKAGLGSALVQMNNPRGALKLFGDAVDLGVPAAEIAADRGLAYDLRGDNKRAQQDYQLALAAQEDPEIRRRLALSLAMSKDRVGALAALDPLLRRQDVPAWRARAFVLALTGDAPGAETAALAVMPRPQAMALLPYLTRLQTLKPAQQAAAVHLGRFPADGKLPVTPGTEALAGVEQVQGAPATRQDSAGRGLIPLGQPLGRGTGQSEGPALASREPASSASRRRPGTRDGGTEKLVTASPKAAPLPPVTANPIPRSASTKPPVSADAGSTERGFFRLPSTGQVIRLADADEFSLPQTKASSKAVTAPTPKASAPKPKDGSGAKSASLLTAAKSGKSQASERGKADPKGETAGKSKPDARTKGDKAEDENSTVRKAEAKAKGQSDPKSKTDDKEESKAATKRKGAERYWVQVAGGATKADLPNAFAKLKQKSPQLLSGRTAWTTPLRATNRLLVGPFKTLDEAQAFVNRAGKSLPAFTYVSPAGQEIEKLPVK